MTDDIDSNSKAISIRLQSDQAGRAGGQRKHDLRHAPIPKYVNQDNMRFNSIIIEPLTSLSLRSVCRDRRSQRQTQRAMKRNASVCVSGIITFGKDVQADFEALSFQAQNSAYLEVAKAIASRLNTTVTGLVAHRDETAPHAHFQLPAYDVTGNAVSTMTKRAVTSELQTIAAEVMKKHLPTVERGRSKYDRLKAGADYSDTINRSVAKLHRDLKPEIKASAAKRDELEKEAQKLAERVAKLHEKEALTSKEVKRLKTYERRLHAKRTEFLSLEKETARLQQIASTHSKQASAAIKAQRDAESRKASAEATARQFRSTTLAEAQVAADNLIRNAESEAITKAQDTAARLEESLLNDGQKALLKAERERNQALAAFELLKQVLKDAVPTAYRNITELWRSAWETHPNNAHRKNGPSRKFKPPGF